MDQEPLEVAAFLSLLAMHQLLAGLQKNVSGNKLAAFLPIVDTVVFDSCWPKRGAMLWIAIMGMLLGSLG